jgi:hypothetical protein
LAVEDGFDLVKLKVGGSVDDDVRRCRIARDVIGAGRRLAVDANQVWGVDDAVDWIRRLAEFDLFWVEEPTSPDDVMGHAAIRAAVAPVPIATGEHVQNRIIFKQLMALGGVDVVQIDAARVAGVNENVAIILLAAKFGLPVCPHAGGVGLCEMVQHLSMFDYVALGGDQRQRRPAPRDLREEGSMTPSNQGAVAIVTGAASGIGAATVDLLAEQGYDGFRSLHEALDTTTPGGRLVFHVFAALAEFIRELIVQGTHEGLDPARARGVRLGRPPALTPEQVRHEHLVASTAKPLSEEHAMSERR